MVTLVNFVHTAERNRAELLQCHQVQHRRHTALTARLHLVVEETELVLLAELHVDLDSVLLEAVLKREGIVTAKRDRNIPSPPGHEAQLRQHNQDARRSACSGS